MERSGVYSNSILKIESRFENDYGILQKINIETRKKQGRRCAFPYNIL